MAAADTPVQDHPSPGRRATPLAVLLFGLMAAPLAWLAAQILGFTLAQRACFPTTEPLAMAAFGGVHAMQAALLVIALVVSLVAAAVAFGAWRRTQDEHTGGSHTLLAVGEGRSRFMAFVGLLTSCGFSVAILFSAPAILLVAAC